LESLLSDAQLDAVIVATPDKLHAQQTIAAASAGKHVLVEKPMATDVGSAKAMVEACEKTGVVLAVAHHMRWHAGLQKLANAVQAGHLGTLRHMRVLWTAPTKDPNNWRALPEVGKWWSLGAVGPHCIDLIRWFMVPSCGEIESIRGTISNKVWNGPHDETAILSVCFASGATAEICCSVVFKAPSRLEIYGSDGYALCDEALGRHGAGSIRTHESVLEYTVANPYVGEVADFVGAIRENRPPGVDGREGLRNVELLVAATTPAPDSKSPL
jgi:1,5-anhydro-D-fructose reductase (1,5-anhydro-D-mannitol-forming)